MHRHAHTSCEAKLRAGSSRRVGQDVTPSTYNQRLIILSSWYTFVQDTYQFSLSR